MGSPQKVFALPVYVLNIAEHTGHLQLASKYSYQGLQLSAALTHTCLTSANIKLFFLNTLILGSAVSERRIHGLQRKIQWLNICLMTKR